MTAEAVVHPSAGPAGVAADVALLLLLILCVPAAILAVGIPIALLSQMVLWLSRLAG